MLVTSLVLVVPAILLGLWAQLLVRSTYNEMQQVPARVSGFAAARQILDSAGLHSVNIEQVPGTMSDHYDPRAKVLRLNQDVYHGRSISAVGIAAHEVGHAIQHANGYVPLFIRIAAVPAANFGSGLGMLLLAIGILMRPLLLLGIIVFSATVFFQLVNLPVEFDASARAERQLVELGIISSSELPGVKKVLNAAALTYVAATLQTILILLYYVVRYISRR